MQSNTMSQSTSCHEGGRWGQQGNILQGQQQLRNIVSVPSMLCIIAPMHALITYLNVYIFIVFHNIFQYMSMPFLSFAQFCSHRYSIQRCWECMQIRCTSWKQYDAKLCLLALPIWCYTKTGLVWWVLCRNCSRTCPFWKLGQERADPLAHIEQINKRIP